MKPQSWRGRGAGGKWDGVGGEAETDRFPLTHTAANRLSAEQLGKRREEVENWIFR